MSLWVCLSSLFVMGFQPQTDSVASPLPGCAVSAAKSFLTASGHHCSLSEIQSEIRAGREDFDPFAVSMYDLREGVTRCGLPVDAIKVPDSDLSQLPTPAILYFAPERWSRISGNSSGHYVTLLGFEENAAVIIDWNGLDPNALVHIPRATLESLWEGEAVVSQQQRTNSFLLPVIAVGLAYAGVIAWRRKSLTPGATSVAVLVCLISAGCGQSSNKLSDQSQSSLKFDSPLIDAGDVSSRDIIDREFHFQVTGSTPVRITGFETSCGCTTVDDGLVGKLLNPGEEHRLQINVRVDPGFTPVVRFVKLITEPPTNPPHTLGIRYVPQERPQLSVSVLRCQTTFGESPTATLLITHRRTKQRKPVRLIREQSSGTTFAIADVKVKTEDVLLSEITQERCVVETHTVELRGQGHLMYGEHQGSLTLRFSDGSEQVLPTELLVEHPIVLKQRRVFLGVLKAGADWNRTISYTHSNHASVDIAQVSAVNGLVKPVRDPDMRIHLFGTAPQIPGRFEDLVEIRFSSDDIPVLRLPVSGIVGTGI